MVDATKFVKPTQLGSAFAAVKLALYWLKMEKVVKVNH